MRCPQPCRGNVLQSMCVCVCVCVCVHVRTNKECESMNRRTYAACMYGCMHVREAWAWQDAPRLPCRRRLASCAWCTTPSPLTCRRHASTPCRTCERGSQVQLCMWVDVCMCVCTRAYAGTCASTQVPEFAYVCTCILAYLHTHLHTQACHIHDIALMYVRGYACMCACSCLHTCCTTILNVSPN